MKKFIAQGILLLIIIGAAFYFYNPTGQPKTFDIPFLPQVPKSSTLKINDVSFTVDIADTDTKRIKGLGEKSSLDEKAGMLFVFDRKDKHDFWMKGLQFPLDFVWISDDIVMDVTENVPAPISGQSDSSLPIYSSKEPVDKVLELNAGSVKKFNIKIGDTITLL